MCGEEDGLEIVPRRSERVHQIEAGHARQVLVDDQDRRGERFQQVEGPLGRCLGRYRVATGGELSGDELADGVVVVDDDDRIPIR